MIASVSRPSRSTRGQVLADGAAVIEPHPGVDRQPVSDRDGVARERGGRDEQAAGGGRIAGDGLRRLPVAVDVPHAGRNDVGPVVLAAFELAADLPLVIGARERRTGSG